MGHLHENLQVFKVERISSPKEGHYYIYVPTAMPLHMNELTECNKQTQEGRKHVKKQSKQH